MADGVSDKARDGSLDKDTERPYAGHVTNQSRTCTAMLSITTYYTCNWAFRLILLPT